MKNTIAIFSYLCLAVFLLFSCSKNSKEKKAESAVKKLPKTEVAPSEAVAGSTASDLALVKAESTGSKYVDWGSQPLETEDGPADSWTMPFMMCQGPPFMDGQLKASSTLAPQGKNNYVASNVCDDDPRTAWVEGKPDYGIGEYLEMKWKPMSDGEISILNGYQASKSDWENNSRVKLIKVSVGGKELCTVELADVMGVQKFKIPGLVKSSEKGQEYPIDGLIRLTIAEVYPGLKYKDTAISGIFSCGG